MVDLLPRQQIDQHLGHFGEGLGWDILMHPVEVHPAGAQVGAGQAHVAQPRPVGAARMGTSTGVTPAASMAARARRIRYMWGSICSRML